MIQPKKGIRIGPVLYFEDIARQRLTNAPALTLVSGSGPLRLVWWDCNVNSNHCPGPDDAVNWQIRRGSYSGPLVQKGFGDLSEMEGDHRRQRTDQHDALLCPDPMVSRGRGRQLE